MDKRNLKYIVLSGVLLIVLIMMQHFAPKPIDWRMNMQKKSKSPYGCLVLSDWIQHRSETNVLENYKSFYGNPLFESGVPGNLVVITQEFKPDELEVEALKKYLDEGNTAFIAANSMAADFITSFGLRIKSTIIDTAFYKRKTETLNFYNPALKKDSGYVFKRAMASVFFEIEDSCKATLIGYGTSQKPNFASIPVGKGTLYLHCQPLVFTNIHLLYSDANYANIALSYLPSQNEIILDNYYNPYNKLNNSPTQYILSETPLRIAFYISIVAILAYLVFGSKRKQRPIAVIEPPKNTSLDFIKTVGSLYFSSKNHSDIARKKSIYFKEFLRDRYYINHLSNTDKCIQHVSDKTGVRKKSTAKTIRKVIYLEDRDDVSEMALIEYNNTLNEFHKNCL